jgi:hypothetical protein
MSTPAPVIVSDAILPSPSDPPKFSNPVARAVWDAGFPGRAKRIEHCGAYRSRRCEDNHVTREHRWCGTRGCDGERCAHALAATLVEKFRVDGDHLIQHAKEGQCASKFTFVDYRFSCEHNSESIQAQATKVIDFLRAKTIREREHRKLILWCYTAGFDDSALLVLRVLFLNLNVDPDELRDRLNAVSADVHTVPMKSIHRFFPLLFKVTIPSTDAGKASMEIAFIGLRRLRTIGQLEIPDVEELLVEEGDGKTSTNNSEVESAKSDDDPPPKPHKLCPICHKKIIEQSGWMPKHLPPPMPDKITYYPASD